MTDRYDEEMLEDLADAPEASHAAHEYDESDEADEADEADEFSDSLEDSGDDELEESADSAEGEDATDELEEAVADALEAEDADEFWGGFGKILKRVGSVARTVAPIASMIPIPQAQLIGRAAGLIGKVLADEGDEMDALDELADFAEEEDGYDALAPAIAGIAIRGALKHRAARIPRPQRVKLVKTVSAVARHIARRHGRGAILAVPAIVHHARKIAIRRGLPAKHLPRLVARIAKTAIRSPRILRKLAVAGSRLRVAGGAGRVGTYGRVGRARHRHAAPMSGAGWTRSAGVATRAGKAATGGWLRSGGSAGACPHCRRRSFTFGGPVTITIRSS